LPFSGFSFSFFFPPPAAIFLFLRMVRCRLTSPYHCEGVGRHASPYHCEGLHHYRCNNDAINFTSQICTCED
jgi:hypothetical protein